MQQDIHPAYHTVKFTCSCGHTYEVGSTIGKDNIHLDVCRSCHPFYTGKQKVANLAGRLQQFQKKFGGMLAVAGKDSGEAASGKA